MITQNDIESLPGSTVLDNDGDKVGTVQQVYISDEGSEPLFVTVKTGLFGLKETFVPLEGATFTEEGLRVIYEQSLIKDAPRIDADQQLSDDEQGTLFDYYDGRAGGVAADRTTDDYRTSDTLAGQDAGTGALAGQDAGADLVGQQDAGAGYVPATDDDATSGRHAETGSVGRDTSGPTTDDAMTLSEERLKVGTQKVETGRARLRKHIVTDQKTVSVPVSHDEVRIEREPITDANVGEALDGPELSEEEHEVVLTEERPVVETEVVPVERVRLTTDTVADEQEVTKDVRREELDTSGVDAAGRTADGDDVGTDRR